MAKFEILGEIRHRDNRYRPDVYIRRHLERTYGKGRWRKRKGIATVRLSDGTVREAEAFTGLKHTGWAEGFQSQKGDPVSDFVICINNESNPASLIVGKVYRTLSDAEAEAHNMLRVIDEDKSEPNGYLYPASVFASVELSEVVKRHWPQPAPNRE